MKKATFRKMSGALLACMMVTSISMPVNAQELPEESQSVVSVSETKEVGTTTVLQNIDKVRGEITAQTYTFSYRTALPAVYEGGSSFKTEFTQGFKIESIELGNWSDYDGNIIVEVYSEDSILDTKTASEREVVDMTAYENVTYLAFKLSDENDGTVRNIDDIKVHGTIDASLADLITATGSYFGYNSIEDTTGTVFSANEVSTDCKYFIPGKPIITLSSNSVTYQESLDAVVNGISGLGNTDCRSYRVTVHIPGRMHITKVIMPEFDNAECKLYIGGVEQSVTDGEVQLDSAAENLILEITTDGKEFSQTKDMAVSMINSVNSVDVEYITVNVTAETVNGGIYAEAADRAEISFTEYSVPVDPDPEPDNPDIDEPDEPVIPDNPDIDEPDEPVKPDNPPKPLDPIVPDNPLIPDTVLPPVNNVIDYTGMNIQSSVASASGNTTFDFSGGNTASSQGSSQTYDFSLFDSVVDDNVTSSTNDENSREESSSLTKDIEEENEKKSNKDDADKISNSRFVQIIAISGGIIIIGGAIVYFIFKPKKHQKNSSNREDD